MRVYIAAPKAEALRARRAASLLRKCGIEVVSTWHETIEEGAEDPFFGREEILSKNLHDLSRANAVLALTSDNAGRETYVEIGRALERGLRVVWSKERGGDALSSASQQVIVVPNDDDAPLYLERWR